MADWADGEAMFSASTQSLPLSEACLQCLCASLNAPVVHVDTLPVGPARAAVVVFAEQYGDLGMAVAIRSSAGGELALLRAQESLPPDTQPAKALELVMAFAEGLGFVFDQDMLGPNTSLAARTSALEHWVSLVGAGASPEIMAEAIPEGPMSTETPDELPLLDDLLSDAAVPGEDELAIDLNELTLGELSSDDLDTGGGELLLDDVSPLEVDDEDLSLGAPVTGLFANEGSLDVGSPRPGRKHVQAEVTEPIQPGPAPSELDAEPDSAAFAASPLSKFRGKPEGAKQAAAPPAQGIESNDEDAGVGGSALGKIKIVRMKKSRDGRAPAKARVLGHY